MSRLVLSKSVKAGDMVRVKHGQREFLARFDRVNYYGKVAYVVYPTHMHEGEFQKESLTIERANKVVVETICHGQQLKPECDKCSYCDTCHTSIPTEAPVGVWMPNQVIRP